MILGRNESATSAVAPGVAIVILVYRNAGHIYQTLDSIFEQDYPCIDIIISDDGSPGFDADRDRISSYIGAHAGGNIRNVTVNALPENMGTVRNVNSALSFVETEFVKVIAAEDMLAGPKVISEYVSYMEEHKECQVCFGRMIGMAPNGEVRLHLAACDEDYEGLAQLSAREATDRLFRRNFLPAPAAFARTSAYTVCGGLDEEVRLIDDYQLWLKLSLAGHEFGYIDSYTVVYCLTGVSSAGSYSAQFIDDLVVIYEKYIFPNDRRFGAAQPVYNALKRGGLAFYASKARWGDMGAGERVRDFVRFMPFRIYTWLERVRFDEKNKAQ